MAYVHSLVRTEVNGKVGWCAPAEVGEASPHYISFVIPVGENRDFFSQYICETVVAESGERRREQHELLQQGKDSFVLHLGELEVWFSVRPVAKSELRSPYLGRLQHADFALLLTEIEPEEPDLLDQLYEKKNTFVIGCEPFSHYSGVEKLASNHLAER
ncbi:MAG TPA: hypothetical protein VNH11_36225 [Pirellulales bacterium]|nr:hypothetical protein [Pirellulales bacterium]